MKPKLDNASSRYGAAMGRRNRYPPEEDGFKKTDPIKLRLQRLDMVDGGYDAGGAYFGRGSAKSGWMYCAFSDDNTVQVFVRAATRYEAKRLVRQELPAATFWR